MKKLIFKLLMCTTLTVSSLTTVSCVKRNNQNFEEEIEMLNMADLETLIREPKPKEVIESYFLEVQKIFSNFNKDLKFLKHYEIVTTCQQGEREFSAGDQVYILPIENNGLIYGKIINKNVYLVSLNEFQEKVQTIKPLPGDLKSSFKKTLDVFLTSEILGLNENSDYTIKYNMDKDDIFSKGDSINIYSNPDSVIIRGSLILQINIFDINSIDFKGSKPRINENVTEVSLRIANNISSKIFNAKKDIDFEIIIFSNSEIFNEGDKVEVCPLPGSKLITGDKVVLEVKTFNLIDFIKDLNDIEFKFKTNKKIFVSRIENSLFKVVPEALINRDYKIICDENLDYFLPSEKVEIEVIEGNNFIIGNKIILEVPKVELKEISKEIKDIEIKIGVTKKAFFESELQKILHNFSPDLDLFNEIQIKMQNVGDCFYGNSQIIIKPNLNSIFFSGDSEPIEITFEYLSTKDLEEFLKPVINFYAGMNKIDVIKIIEEIISVSNEFSPIINGTDFYIDTNGESDILTYNDWIHFGVFNNSNILSGEGFDLPVLEMNIEKLTEELFKIEFNKEDSIYEHVNKVNYFLSINAPFMVEYQDYEILSVCENYFTNKKTFTLVIYSGKWLSQEKELVFEI